MATTYEPIATSDISAVNSVTFSSIPSTYTDIRIIVVQTQGIEMIFNGDGTSNYSQFKVSGNGTTSTAQGLTNRGSMYPQETNPNAISNCIIDIFNYTGNIYKMAFASASTDNNGSGTTERKVMVWRSTAVINSITLRTGIATNFGTGSRATLYGIKSA